MKKLALSLALIGTIFAAPAFAGPRDSSHHHRDYSYHRSHEGRTVYNVSKNNWVFPFLGGLALGSLMDDSYASRTTYVSPQVVYTSPAYVINTRPIVYLDEQPTGYIMHQPVYQEVIRYVPSCNCYRSFRY